MLVSTVKELVATALAATSSREHSSGCHRKVLEMIAKICRYAAENGNKTIINKFTGDLGFICTKLLLEVLRGNTMSNCNL